MSFGSVGPGAYGDWLARAMQAKRADFSVNCCNEVMLFSISDDGTPATISTCRKCGATVNHQQMLAAHGLEELGTLDVGVDPTEVRKHS